jgi:hypothetical protein
MKTLTPESNKHELPPEDRDFYVELGAGAALALAIVLLI